jgi:soluble lytic murein transglycosylase-like protein
VFALVPAAIVAGALMNVPAQASCERHGGCATERVETKSKATKAKVSRVKSAHTGKVRAGHVRRSKSAHAKPAKSRRARHVKAVTRVSHRHPVPFQNFARLRTLDDFATRHMALAVGVSGFAPPSAETGHAVVAMIESMSPSYAVPTWFALRIAKIESNYNPNVRGSEGEYGVFQIKCDTARMIGFAGDCAELADARTNVEWGLKHLSEALKSSNGNLKLAASKHNAGLGRQTLVARYVNLVF